MIGGNGYLAVYVAGLVVGNKRLALKRTIATFLRVHVAGTDTHVSDAWPAGQSE